jgi:hypothetical protein
MPRAAFASTLVALGLLAGILAFTHAPAPSPHVPASLSTLDMTFPTDLPQQPPDTAP